MRARAARRSPESPSNQVPAGLAGRPFSIQARRDSAPLTEKSQAEIDRPEEKTAELGASFSNVRVFPQEPTGNGNPLPSSVRQKMEAAFHTDFSDVRVHQGASDAESLSALAFTQGRDIHFAPGQYRPATLEGQKIIAHELTHVVQQRQGRVATPQGKGVPVNAEQHLEKEADQLGDQAVRGEPINVPGRGPEARPKAGLPGSQPIQPMLRSFLSGLSGGGGSKKPSKGLDDDESPLPSSIPMGKPIVLDSRTDEEHMRDVQQQKTAEALKKMQQMSSQEQEQLREQHRRPPLVEEGGLVDKGLDLLGDIPVKNKTLERMQKVYNVVLPAIKPILRQSQPTDKPTIDLVQEEMDKQKN
jgi:Domain of unknown function (DUF4157)